MRIIQIRQGFYKDNGEFGIRHIPAIVDEEMYDEVSQYGWSIDGQGYARADIRRPRFADKRKTILMHRLVTSPLPGLVVHHKNGNILDNRRCNLMVLTPSEHTKIHWAQDRDKMLRKKSAKTRTEASDAQRKAAAKMPRKGRKEST